MFPYREEKVEEEEGVLDTLDAGLHDALVALLTAQHYSMQRQPQHSLYRCCEASTAQ